jgi:hypothetical protein
MCARGPPVKVPKIPNQTKIHCAQSRAHKLASRCLVVSPEGTLPIGYGKICGHFLWLGSEGLTCSFFLFHMRYRIKKKSRAAKKSLWCFERFWLFIGCHSSHHFTGSALSIG